jgi:DNA-binding CsgD family transcriptional regulator
MKTTAIEFSNELQLRGCKNGIQLLTPDISINRPTITNVFNFPFPVYFQDSNHKTIACNDVCTEALGFASQSDCIGSPWFKPFIRNTVVKSILTDKVVINNEDYKIAESIAQRKDTVPIHTLSIRMPWFNSDNKVIGLFGLSIIVGRDSIIDSLSLIESFGLMRHSCFNFIPLKINNVYFTTRENQCLKLTIKGKSAKQIAGLLDLSPRTVEEYLTNIKFKLGVNSKSELIELVLDNLDIL